MRTNIDLDDDLIREARKYSSARTKRALVEQALRTFIEMKSEQQRWKDHEQRVAKILKKTSKLRLDESAVDMIRADRNR
jgi:Arc/MetJ family transcription regulator